MKQFQAQFIYNEGIDTDLDRVSAILDTGEWQPVDNLLWSNNTNIPVVSFSIAYTANSILLKYRVKEKYLQAVYREINDPVYEDSCVEFFIAFNNESNYYNLEFNCLGTALVAYGSDKNNRVKVKKQLVQEIKSRHIVNAPDDVPGALFNWELTLNIPFTIFEHHHISTLKNQVCGVNFYKCGDKLPEPHFLSWSNIVYPHPNFHLPEFFGRVKFVP